MARFLSARGIGTGAYYPKPLHLQGCFAFLENKPGGFPEAERAARETLALPMYPELIEQMQDQVIRAIWSFFLGD